MLDLFIARGAEHAVETGWDSLGHFDKDTVCVISRDPKSLLYWMVASHMGDCSL